MTRFFKLFLTVGMSSVYLMQAPCSITNGSGGLGFSIFPNIPLSLGGLVT